MLFAFLRSQISHLRPSKSALMNSELSQNDMEFLKVKVDIVWFSRIRRIPSKCMADFLQSIHKLPTKILQTTWHHGIYLNKKNCYLRMWESQFQVVPDGKNIEIFLLKKKVTAAPPTKLQELRFFWICLVKITTTARGCWKISLMWAPQPLAAESNKSTWEKGRWMKAVR